MKTEQLSRELIFENFIFSNEHQHRLEVGQERCTLILDLYVQIQAKVRTGYLETITFVTEAK